MRRHAAALSTLAALIMLLAPGSVRADDPIQLEVLETDDLKLLYFIPAEYLAPHATRHFENSLAFQRTVFGWMPWERTTVLLKDFGDYGNAAARSAPNNALMFDIAPLSRTMETFVASERMFMLMNHELIHVATMDQWTEQDARWRRFFAGKPVPDDAHPESILYSYLVTPRTTVPRWYLEGSAVFMETWMGGGLGRGQGAYDEMVFRAMVRDDAHFYDPLGLVSEGTHIDFQVGVNAYLYGTRFMSYLALEYTPQHLIDWYARTEGSERYYADRFEQVFGRPLDEVWQDWIAFEREFQEANLTSVRSAPVTEHRELPEHPLGSVSRAYVDPERRVLIGGFRYPGVVAHIGELSLEDGSVEVLVDVKGPQLYRVTSLAYDPEERIAYYTADNYAFRDLMALDVDSGETTMLQEDVRIGELVLDPASRALYGVRHLNGLASLVRIPPPYDSWELVRTMPYGVSAFDLDVSPDGRLLSMSVGEVDGDHFLRVFELAALQAGGTQPLQEFDFGLAVPEGFVFSPDGRYLYGSSYYTGVSNIFRFEVGSAGFEAVTNAETGYFRPIPLEDGRLIAFSYTGDGFIPVVLDPEPLDDVGSVSFLGNRVAQTHPEVAEWSVVASSREVDVDALVTHRGSYSTIGDLSLQSIYPVVEGYKDLAAFGVHATIADPMGFDTIELTASYSPQSDLDPDERWHLRAQYMRRGWTVGATLNRADFYDLFGPVQRSRRGHSLHVGYERALIYDRPRQLDFNISLDYFGDLEELPYAQDQNVFADQLSTFSTGLEYSNMRSSLGHVTEEKGYRWSLELYANRPERGDIVPAVVGEFDFGFALPWRHSSIWLRNAGGSANGSVLDPFAQFFLGGFRNNWVDNGDVQSYRDWRAFPGFDIDALAGRSFARSMLEWNLPPLRFSGVGTPGAYASHIRTALFTSYLATDPESEARRQEYRNVGIQFDLDFTVMHRLPMTLSLGYAIGMRDGLPDEDEIIISLKVL